MPFSPNEIRAIGVLTMYYFYSLKVMVFIGLCMLLTGCPVVRASGDAVKATGEGVGHAVEGTGDAIGRAGHELAPR